IASHYEAQQALDEILAEGFREMGSRVRSGRVTEYDMVQWLQEAMRRADLAWEHGTNVSVNENSADSHYEPAFKNAKEIRVGDFVLIDIWARKNRPGTCYYDITWTGVVGREPSEHEQHVFSTVKAARDATIKTVKEAFANNQPIAGWQADDAARAVIRNADYGEYFTHRTGHNIGNILHGNGAHLDNLETHDERLILPNTCFSVEPGIYLDKFGIRSEVNMIATPGKAVVTGRIQQELVRI
ncbi:MAG: M24 family metallopeptidase, partial [Acidobacteriaceae bacterium]